MPAAAQPAMKSAGTPSITTVVMALGAMSALYARFRSTDSLHLPLIIGRCGQSMQVAQPTPMVVLGGILGRADKMKITGNDSAVP